MPKQVIKTSYRPKYHFSEGIKTEQFIFVAGTIGAENPATGEAVKGIEAQTRQALDIIKETLENGGSSLEDVVNTTVYLPNPDDFIKMNEVYKGYFPKDPPARATVSCRLLRPEWLVEIQAIADCSSAKKR
ncbi:MAG: RidA family protein [Chloroflexota bacterium]|nr:RidA family protein [Chloroflexota bacterium]